VNATLENLTAEARRVLSEMESEPVGVMTAYRNALLRLADAIDRIAAELDARTKPR
jgi:hypothetical protein